MRKKLVSMLLVVSMVALVGCGSDKKSGGDKKDGQTAATTEASDADKLQDFMQDNINGENVDAAIAKLNPTYKVNTKDVSEYYYSNPNISLGKSFMEMPNISSITLEHWEGYNEENAFRSSDFEYSSLEEIADKYILEEDEEQLDIFFSEGANIRNEDFSGLYNSTISFSGGEYIDPYNAYKNEKVMKFGDILENGGSITSARDAYSMNPGVVSPTIQLKELFNIDFEGNAEESLLHLKELWGEPSAIKCSKAWGITDVYWIFESDVVICFELNSIMSDETNIGAVYFTWTDSEKRMEKINTQYVDPEYDDQYWYKRADAPQEETKYESYPANLPENIVVTLGDKSVVVTKDNWKNIFAELGVTPNAEDRYNLDADFTVKEPRGIEIYDDKLIIYLPNLVGTYETELSVFGINAENTIKDVYKVFGTDVSYTSEYPDYTYYKYKEIPYEGVEAVQFVSYDVGSLAVEIWWE